MFDTNRPNWISLPSSLADLEARRKLLQYQLDLLNKKQGTDDGGFRLTPAPSFSRVELTEMIKELDDRISQRKSEIRASADHPVLAIAAA